MKPFPASLILAMLLVLGLVPGCSTPKRDPVPAEMADAAIIEGLPEIRFWGDVGDPRLVMRYSVSLEREMALAGVSRVSDLPPAHMLALSGGGADGAFGAGLLCGWTQRGDRPDFKIVTGVSTGALIAPFAFVGPEYDHVLRDVYRGITTDRIATSRGVLGGLTSDAFADTAPLRRLLEQHVTEEFVDAVARESAKGRLLLIGTTNMDAGRPVVWGLGALARSDHPDRVRLFREVMIASASIPAVFPPVMISVQGPDGRTYDEMHADGGVTSQVFLYPAAFSFRDLSKDAQRRTRHVYVIRNAQVTPRHQALPRTLFPIAKNAISALIRAQGVGDLYRIYLGCQRDGIDYNLATIPESFTHEPKEAFDPDYMRELFDLGESLGRDGYPWAKAPPGMSPLDPPQEPTSARTDAAAGHSP